MYHPGRLGWDRSVGFYGERITSFVGELPAEGVSLQSVAVPFDVHHLAMVQQAVEDGRRDDRIAEEFLPVAEALVGRDDGRASLVAVRHELEEEVRLLAGYREVAHFVHDHQVRAEERFLL